jgi:MFS family permease
VVATAFEALAVATIMPAVVRELADLELYGWAFSAFLLTNLIGITVGGGESDRIGPARVIVAGTLLFASGLIVSGFAPSMLVIVLGRALQGFGGGLLFSAAYAALARAYYVETQPRVLAVLSSAWVIPGLVGPGIAGLVTEHASWRWVFVGLVPMPILATLLVIPALRTQPKAAEAAAPADDPRKRIVRSVQLGAGAAIALSALTLRPWPLGVAAVAAGTLLAIDALRALLPPGTLLARAGLPAAVASMALVNFAFFGTEAFVPLALDRVRHAPVLLTGSALTAAAITWTVGAWLPVRLAGRVSRRTLILVGHAVLGVGLLGTAALLSPSVHPASAVAAWAVTGLGMGLAYTCLSAAILQSAEPGRAGIASASLQLAQVLGAAVATGAGGAIVAAPFAGDPPVVGIAVVDGVMLAALLVSAFAARRVHRL